MYFLASIPRNLWHAQAPMVLMAVNELHSSGDEQILQDFVAAGVPVLLDSGVYHLAMAHAKAHDLDMDAALAVPVQEIDGFDDLYGRYVAVMTQYGRAVWGYIELDLGGPEGKRRTRAALEAVGLAPMPVYHPLNDGWAYFEELAETYDRICLGNIVHATAEVRLRLLATLWERKQAFPELWVHGLGFTPNEWLLSYPLESCDSSSWLSGSRWDGYQERTALHTLGNLPKAFQYELGNRETYHHGLRMASLGCDLNRRNYRNHLASWGMAHA